MTFLSPSFIFVFLPIAIALYAIAPKFRRIDLLPMLSAVFFVCINIQDLLSLVYYFSIVIASAVALKAYKKTKKRRYLIGLQILAFAAAVVSLLYRFLFGSLAVYHAGLLVCLMAVTSMCSDIVNSEGRAPDTVWEALVYVTFFPVMLAGPFIRYGDFIEKLDGVSFSLDNCLMGIVRFMIGFIKCVGISAVMGSLYDEVVIRGDEFGFAVLILVAAVCGVRIYTFFSGYSDMARGIALMIGLDIKKDFKDPFLNVTPVDYAKRFFRSLSEFAKLYVIAPIEKLFGGRILGKLLACACAGGYYVFIISPSPMLALILFLPVSVLAFFVLVRSKDKRLSFVERIKLPCAIVTFLTVSFVWLMISVGDLDSFIKLISDVFSNGAFYASHNVKGIILAGEYVLVPTVLAVLVFVISRVLDVEHVDSASEISVKDVVLRSVCMTALAIIFILAVTMLLPRYSQVVSYANLFRFV